LEEEPTIMSNSMYASRGFRPHSAETQRKIDRAYAVKAQRDTLGRARQAVERIVARLEQEQEHRRQASVGDGGESYLLGEAIRLRGELYSLEL
jgi:hypothetical protein